MNFDVCRTIDIDLYLDESGKCLRNHRSDYFAVGGFYCLASDLNQIVKRYRKQNRKMKKARNMDLSSEIKAYEMNPSEKIRLIQSVQDCLSFSGVGVIYNKQAFSSDEYDESVVYLRALKLIVHHIVDDVVSFDQRIRMRISCDKSDVLESCKSEFLRDLYEEFSQIDIEFELDFLDSSVYYKIQIADLVVNTFLLSNQHPDKVQSVIEIMNPERFWRLDIPIEPRAISAVGRRSLIHGVDNSIFDSAVAIVC